MTPSGIRGVGQKSNRTRALELWRLKYTPEEIARTLEVEVDQVFTWITPKSRQRASGGRSRGISEASPEQREKVKGRACIVCRKHAGSCHPMHLVDRSIGGDDDPRAVLPGCPGCHRLYDEGGLDLLPYLEPHYREEIAYAVECVGLMAALRRITNDRWVPVTTGGPE